VPEDEFTGVIRFGIFEVDLRAGELRRNGTKIRLQDQPFQVLALLLAKPGELVTREELQGKLWPADTFVDFDHGLNAAVKRLRDALDDSADNPRFIETLARRGYRFIAPVNEPAPAVASKEQRSTPQLSVPWRLLGSVPHKARYGFAVVAIFLVLHFGILVGWQAGHRSSASMRFAERRLTGNPENDPVLSAAISPDGKYLAFADRTGMFLRMVSSGETHPVSIPDMGRVYASAKEPGPLSLSWFPDGSHLLATRAASASFGAKSSLWAISVFGGQPRKLMDEAALGAVSPDGSQIVFVRGDFGRHEIWVMQSDGTQPHKILGQPGANYESVVWSPDGHAVGYIQVVLLSGWHQADVSLGVVDLDSGKSSSVLSTDRLRGALAWTRDGRLIYSLAEAPPNQNDSNLWAIKVDGRGKQNWGQAIRLTAGPDAKVRASVSADGKRLIFLRWAESPVVYISEVTGRRSSTHLSSLQRLSLDERENYPYTWTPDGKSIIFTSDRDGVSHLFKQGIDQPAPDLLVGGDRSVVVARLNPSGSEILYTLSPASGDTDGRMRIMRVPLAGGTPQLVLAEPGINNLQCARLPSTVCVFSEYTTDHVAFYTFDPMTGKKAPLTQISDSEWYLQNWTLSPDGLTIALAKKHRIPGVADIRLFPLAGGKERMLTLRSWTGIACLDWAADGRSLWVNASSPAGVPTLLNVDLQGRAWPVLEESEKELGWAIPSPDGRYLAIWEASGNSNAWLLESF
jgi:Tol biopolymer transport system component/DNA-binding winged helix-turn-helix (wHTH) protein